MKTLIANDTSIPTHFAQPCSTFRTASKLLYHYQYKLTKCSSDFLCNFFLTFAYTQERVFKAMCPKVSWITFLPFCIGMVSLEYVVNFFICVQFYKFPILIVFILFFEYQYLSISSVTYMKLTRLFRNMVKSSCFVTF